MVGAVGLPAAEAAPITLTSSSLTIDHDGTGYGSTSQCFLEPTATAATGPTDGNVCSNDVVQFNWNFNAPASASPDPIVLSQTLPAGWTWSSNTASACSGDGTHYTGVSTISPDGLTLTCTVTITSDTGVVAQLGMQATPSSSAVPNVPYTGSLGITGASAPITDPASRPVTVLSAPDADAVKSTPNGSKVGFTTIAGVDYSYWGYRIAVTGLNSKGSQALVTPYSFYDDLSAFPAGTVVQITACPGATCVYDAATQRVNITVASGTGYIGNGSLNNITLTVLVPVTDGNKNIPNTLRGFQPHSIFNTPNVEPSTANNTVTVPFSGPQVVQAQGANGQKWTMRACTDPLTVITIGGDCQVNNAFAVNSAFEVNPGGPVWSKVAVYDGLSSAGTGQPITNATVCDYWDPATYHFDTTRSVYVSQGDGTLYNASDYTLEYSNAVWPDPQNSPQNTSASTNCQSNAASWTTNLASIGGAANVTGIRAVYTGNGGQLGETTDTTHAYFQLTIPFTMDSGLAAGDWFNVGKIDFTANGGDLHVSSPQFARIGAYDLTLRKTSVPTATVNTGSPVSYTVTPGFQQVGGAAHVAVSGLVVTDSMDNCLGTPTFDAATLAFWNVTLMSSATPGNDGIACTRDTGESPAVYRFTPIDAAGMTNDDVLPVITYTTTTAVNAPPDSQIINTATIATDQVAQLTVSHVLSENQVHVSGIQKTVSSPTIMSGGSPVGWTVTVSNQLTTSLGNTQWIDVLPYVGDGRASTATLHLSGPATLHGDLSGATIDYTTDPNPDPAVVGNTDTWTTTPDWSKVTAVRITESDFHTQFLGTFDIPSITADAAVGSVLNNSVTGTALLGTGNTTALALATANTAVIGSSIGDYIWIDTNGNGIQDPGEKPVAGYPVKLTGTDVNGAAVSLATVTDSTGKYLFANLAAGTYSVTFDPSGLTGGERFTLKGAGTDPTLDSDADLTTGVAAAVTVGTSDQITDVDAGIIIPPVTPGGPTIGPIIGPVLAFTGATMGDALTLSGILVAIGLAFLLARRLKLFRKPGIRHHS
jgi:hypothetical protein